MSIDEQVEIERARSQIRALVAEIEQLSRSDLAEADFFRGLLERVLMAMEAVAGLVWLVGDGGRVEPICHAGVEHTGIAATPETQAAHGALVQALVQSPTGLLVPPHSEVGSGGASGKAVAANDTGLLVIAAPIERGGVRAGLIEVFHQQNQPDVERGYLTFLEQVSAVAADYLGRRQLKTLDSQQTALTQVERFSRAVHESLDPVATAFVLANEARRIIGCDRVSVLVRRRRKLRLEAVSGQESVERRASAVQAIEALVRVVATAGDPLWHPDPARELPPQIEEELEHYIDESHATALAIIPLEKPRPTPVVKPGGVDAVAVAKAEAGPQVTPEPIAALVAEWFSSSSFDDGKRARVDLVAEHGKVAIANALAHTSLPFYGLSDLLGKSRVLTTARNLPRSFSFRPNCGWRGRERSSRCIVATCSRGSTAWSRSWKAGSSMAPKSRLVSCWPRSATPTWRWPSPTCSAARLPARSSSSPPGGRCSKTRKSRPTRRPGSPAAQPSCSGRSKAWSSSGSSTRPRSTTSRSAARSTA
jgi:GAF domain-containing protein